MSQPEEKFNLDRQTNMKQNIDALGKKWEIHKKSPGQNLYVARPNPFRADFICPKNMEGAWTSPDKLQTEIDIYLNKSWNQADRAALPLANTPKKITPEASLEALSPEIKEALSDILPDPQEQAQPEPVVAKTAPAKKKAPSKPKAKTKG